MIYHEAMEPQMVQVRERMGAALRTSWVAGEQMGCATPPRCGLGP